METSKQKAIQKAYGEYWDSVKDYIDNNGWINTTKFSVFTAPTSMPNNFETNGEMCRKIRPKSLKGIENNNGWIKIKSKRHFPKNQNFSYKIGKMFENGKFFQFSEAVSLTTVKSWFEQKKITHYMLNKIEPDPIY